MKVDKCNRCSIELGNENWHKSASKRRWLICKSCANVRQNKYNKNNPDKVHKRNCEKKYGITYTEYQLLLERQNFVCAICEKGETSSSRINLSIDHCHDTGIVRGLLCTSCNTGLGRFKDDINLLKKAVEYLRCDVN